MTDLYDYHNGPNLGLEPTTPMKAGVAPQAQPSDEDISEAMKQDDEVMAALLRSRTVAMKWAARARIPECAKFSDIAQDLDFVIGEILALREELSKMRAEPSDEEIRSEQVRRMAEDAARYRWLRKGESNDVAVVRGLGSADYGMSAVVYTFSEEIDGDDLDAAIDAAMHKEGKQ